MDFELTDEQRLVKDTARAFTDNEIVHKIADQGDLGAIVPTKYGGAGLDYLTYGLIVEEIGRGDSAMRTAVSVQASIAKLYATEAAVACANTVIQVHGGSGYVDDHPLKRYFRDVRVTTLYEGTSPIQKLIIGRALTGINALVPS